jgi:hypothetical protein
MTAAQVMVTLAGAALAIGVNVYFFGPRRGRRGAPRDGGSTVPRAGGGSLVMPGDGHPGENPRPPAA